MEPARAGGMGDDPTLVWTEDFSVGVPQLDADHRTLFELAAILADASLPIPAQTVTTVLDALAEYTVAHFNREERYQEALGYPGLEGHRLQHRQLIERLDAFRARHAADPSRVDVTELRHFLRRWLVNHVLHEDMKYRWYEEGDYPAP